MASGVKVESPSNHVANLSDNPTPRDPAASTCPRCGTAPAVQHDDGQSRVAELEAQVRLLTDKATSAVDKLADYEDELRKLKASERAPAPTSLAPPNATVNANADANRVSSTSSSPPPPASTADDDAPKPLPPTPAPGEPSTLHHRPSVKNRFPSFLTRSNSRSPATTAAAGPLTAAAVVSSRENELAAQLTQERALREAAEGKVTQMSSEMEDLSVTLFQQANEMVADERQARAKLEERAMRFEERCGVLEEKVRVLEKRDGDKRKRLETLEVAVARIERIRKLLDVR